jgi:hypothetical protein
VNGQVDADAVNFFAKFMDLMIWLSFQKEGATNPAPAMASPSPSTSDEERVWRDVVQAIDRNMFTAISTSFSLSGNVHPNLDIPPDMIRMDDDDADRRRDKAQSPQITAPSPASAPPLHAEPHSDQQAEPLPTPVSIKLTTSITKALQMI